MRTQEELVTKRPGIALLQCLNYRPTLTFLSFSSSCCSFSASCFFSDSTSSLSCVINTRFSVLANGSKIEVSLWEKIQQENRQLSPRQNETMGRFPGEVLVQDRCFTVGENPQENHQISPAQKCAVQCMVLNYTETGRTKIEWLSVGEIELFNWCQAQTPSRALTQREGCAR